MKHKLFIPLFALAVLRAGQGTAQNGNEGTNAVPLPTEKGSLMVGANLANASLGFGGGSLSTSLNVNPRVGYSVTDNFVPGISLGAGFGISGDIRVWSAGVGLYGRYYFGKLRDKDGNFNRLRPFAELGAGFATNNYRNNDAFGMPEWHNLYGVGVQALAGADYFLNRNVALEAGIDYGAFFTGDLGWDASNTVRLNLGLQIFLPRGKVRQPVN